MRWCNVWGFHQMQLKVLLKGCVVSIRTSLRAHVHTEVSGRLSSVPLWGGDSNSVSCTLHRHRGVSVTASVAPYRGSGRARRRRHLIFQAYTTALLRSVTFLAPCWERQRRCLAESSEGTCEFYEGTCAIENEALNAFENENLATFENELVAAFENLSNLFQNELLFGASLPSSPRHAIQNGHSLRCCESSVGPKNGGNRKNGSTFGRKRLETGTFTEYTYIFS